MMTLYTPPSHGVCRENGMQGKQTMSWANVRTKRRGGEKDRGKKTIHSPLLFLGSRTPRRAGSEHLPAS